MQAERQVMTLRDAGVQLLDCVHRTPPAAETGYPYIAIPQVKDGRLDLRDVRLISPQHFADWTRKTRPREWDVILSRRCNPGETAVVPAELECALGQNLVVLRANGKYVDPQFLRWLVRSRAWWQQIETFINVGAVFDSLKCADIPNFRLPIPPLPEQRAIARLLGALDDKIELNRRMNETLEAMARALFKSWFVDFDPVHAKAEGRDPGLPEPIADLFPARLVDSEVGEMPEGWEVGSVDDEFDLVMGQSPPGNTYNELGGGMPFYQGRADFGFRYPKHRVFCTAPTRLARAGDTLVSVRAPVGDINMAAEDCAIGRGVASARHKTGSRSYSYQFMRSLDEVFARFEAGGTVFGSINKSDFRSISVIRPPRVIIAQFERAVSVLDGRTEINERGSGVLRSLRDALLPKLISGELRVREGERVVAEAAA
jgi:type I restriction enzyme S subunit